jgi:hypothetical protein
MKSNRLAFHTFKKQPFEKQHEQANKNQMPLSQEILSLKEEASELKEQSIIEQSDYVTEKLLNDIEEEKKFKTKKSKRRK